MKSLLFVALFLVLAAVATGGAFLFLSAGSVQQAAEMDARLVEQAAAPEAEDASRQLQDLRTQVAHLNSVVSDLQTQIAHLQSVASREAIPAETEPVTPDSLAAAGLTAPQIEARMRDVIAAEKAREEQERADQRAQRELENAKRQAERVAKELGLSVADTNVLAQHLVTTSAKRNDLFTQMREGGFERNAIRESMNEMREWNSQELDRLFGPTLAPQIEEKTSNDWGRGGGRGGNIGGGRRGGGGG